MTMIGTKLARLLLACLLCGFLLAQMGITADAIFTEAGMDAALVREKITQVMGYILPLMVTGSLIVIPIWLALSIFRSPSE